MFSLVLSRMVILVCGTLYPAYRSYKTVKTKNVREYVKWMMYWIVFAIFLCAESLADVFVSFWFPFYYETKILFVVWLISPYTKGASFIYRKFIHPILVKHERDIDECLDKAKYESYSTFMRFGSKTIVYAKEVVATAAIKGQEQLVNQLRKSYSLGDVSENADGEFVDSARQRRDTLNALQRVDEDDVDVRVWEGHYDAQGIVEQELKFADDDPNSQPAAATHINPPHTATKTQVDRKKQPATTTTKTTKQKDIEIYATMTKRGQIPRTVVTKK